MREYQSLYDNERKVKNMKNENENGESTAQESEPVENKRELKKRDYEMMKKLVDYVLERIGQDKCHLDLRFLIEAMVKEELSQAKKDLYIKWFKGHGGYCDCEIIYNTLESLVEAMNDEAEKYDKKMEQKLKKMQRQLLRKKGSKKGEKKSQNWLKLKKRIDKKHMRIINRRINRSKRLEALRKGRERTQKSISTP